MEFYTDNSVKRICKSTIYKILSVEQSGKM